MVIGNNRACFVEEFVSEEKRFDETSIIGDNRACFVDACFRKEEA